MSLPGFNAEYSLSSAASRFRMVGTTDMAGRGEVAPQFCYTNPGGSTTCCQCFYGWCDCHVLHRHVLM
jgi:hypothetical protein